MWGLVEEFNSSLLVAIVGNAYLLRLLSTFNRWRVEVHLEWPDIGQCLAKSRSIPQERHWISFSRGIYYSKLALNLESPSSAIQNRHHLSILGGKSPVFPLQRQNILCLEKQLFFTPAWRFVKLFSGDVAEQMWTQNKKMKRPRFFCLKIAP